MESGSMAAPPAVGAGLGSAPGDKGLKTGALGFVSNVVIGVASTAPGYSLAASLGLVVGVAGIGLQAPAILLAAFVPMLLHRRVLLLHEPCRSGLRHHLLVGHQGDGPVRGLDRRLGDHRRRHHRHGQPGPDRRPLQLPALRLAERGRLDHGGDHRRASCGS